MKSVLLIAVSFCLLNSAYAVFVRVNGLEKEAVSKISVSGLDDNKIYAVSSRILFVSNDGGVSWDNIFVAKGEDIKDIYIDKHIYGTVYVITDSSVYRFNGREREKIFSLPSEIKGLSIYGCNGIVYAGTTNGVYYAYEGLWKWSKLGGLDSGISVYSVCCLPSVLLVAASNGVYVSNKKGMFIKELVLKKVDTEKSQESNKGNIVCRKITPDIFNHSKVYLGTSKGLFVSFDKGRTWQRITIPSIYNADIRDVRQSYTERKSVYLATDRGIFSVDTERGLARPIFEGLTTRDILDISFNHKGILFAATSKGLFMRKQGALAKSFVDIDKLIRSEPSIREIQEAALRYNEVHPDKIKKWREALKKRALAPSVTTKVGGSVGNTYEIYTSKSTSYYATGPADRNTYWSVSLSWDIGDLIWNSYEDDVDTRSRLMTQLRINILDDINTIYFERLRIKERLMSNDYGSIAEKMKDELRLKELTASLDGYTGGYFSKRMRELHKK